MSRKFKNKLPNKLPVSVTDKKGKVKAPKTIKTSRVKTEKTEKTEKAKKVSKPRSVEKLIEDTFSAANTIKILEQRNRQLQDTIDTMQDSDKPYGHNKSTDYLVFGRTREQYDDLLKIVRHLKATNKHPTEAIEKIENYPLKTRDKFILLLELTMDANSK